jgi:NADH-quinone oxidoreductase subunit L
MIGSLALCAMPPFAGFYSKDTIIEAVKISTTPGAGYAYVCVLAGVFVTALYTFRALFMTFHTKSRIAPEVLSHVKESPMTVLIPLVALAIPSLMIGEVLITPMLYSNVKMLGNTIFVLPEHNVMYQLSFHYQGAKRMALEAGMSLTFWIMIAGIITAWLFTARYPRWSDLFVKRFPWLYTILINKYGFDEFNKKVLVDGTLDVGHLCYDVSDVKMIDGVAVNGSGRLIQWVAQQGRRLQTGYLYHYALAMVLGTVVMLVWYVGGF